MCASIGENKNRFLPCVPLVWRPVWAFNFGEQFANTMSPLHELHTALFWHDSHENNKRGQSL